MSNIYDNWERLVHAVLHEEKLRRNALRDFTRLSLSSFSSSSFSFQQDEYQKAGKIISKGRKNYDLMFNVQLGIRYSVGKFASAVRREVRQSDFDPKANLLTRLRPRGSKNTPPNQSMRFMWKDYRPLVFRSLREMFKLDIADYMLAICGDDALREQSSPGKNGSFCYLTQDGRFMIKKVKKSEVKVLIKMLPIYYQHVRQFNNILIRKFYGAYCVSFGGVKTRFIVMDKLLFSEYQLHRRYNLKGSHYGCYADIEEEIDETTTLKDLDLDFVFQLQPHWYRILIKQIDQDLKFLEENSIVNYSLLIGVHFCNIDTNINNNAISLPKLLQHKAFPGNSCFLGAEHQDMDRTLAIRKPLTRLGVNMPAIAKNINNCEIYRVILLFGFVGILQDYDISKKLEHAYKSLQVEPTSISAVDPKLYSKRFRDFIRKVFVEDINAIA